MELSTFFILFASYLIGSIPFGVLFGRTIKNKDPRTGGSRNIGFTNVLRVAGALPAVLTLGGDLGKGALAALMGKSLGGHDLAMAAGLFAILGHCYPIFLWFRGGKAIATSFGVLAIVHPLAGVLTFGVWLVTVLLSKYVSLGSLVAFASLPIGMIWLDPGWNAILFSATMAFLVFLRHRDNILRLWGGTEHQIFQR